jgi:hypothetical protein
LLRLSGASWPMIAYHIIEKLPLIAFLLFIYILGQPHALGQNK